MQKNKSEMSPELKKLFEGFDETRQKLDAQNMNLARKYASLKIAMACKEAAWEKEKENMQNAFYKILKEELHLLIKETEKELRLQEKDYRSLNDHYQSQQAEIHQIRRDLKLKCDHVNELEYSIKQREQVIDRTVHEKQALEEQNNELTNKLKAMETNVLQNEPDWQSQIKALKDELSREQAEKEAASNRIKELERLLKVTEEKWVTEHEAGIVQKDQKIASLTSQNKALEASNQKLISMQQAMETRIVPNMTEWETKVDALEDHLSCERAEKEAASKRIKELEKLVSDTDQMWAAKHEADIKLLILKQIKLQELALMTDKEKAKMEKEQKKAKKEAEKRPKKELKEKMQEKSSLFSCIFSSRRKSKANEDENVYRS